MHTMTALLDAAMLVLAEGEGGGANVPNPGPQQPPGTSGISDILGWIRWISLAICVGALMAIGAMMAIPSVREHAGDAAGKVIKALFGVIIISGAGIFVGFLA